MAHPDIWGPRAHVQLGCASRPASPVCTEQPWPPRVVTNFSRTLQSGTAGGLDRRHAIPTEARGILNRDPRRSWQPGPAEIRGYINPSARGSRAQPLVLVEI